MAEPAVVKYNQVGVMEMAAEYNLVQCKVIHQDKSYDCTLDSGSCLNLVHWKTVKDFGLADRLVNTSISYKVADGHIAHTMGELPDVELSFGDCVFKITFSVVDRMDHTILLGTSFMHQARCVLSFHKKEPQLYLSDGKGHQSTIPVTYHRSHQWIRSLGSDKRNWPSETSIREEGAPVPRVSMIFPRSKTIEADPPVLTISVEKPAGGELETMSLIKPEKNPDSSRGLPEKDIAHGADTGDPSGMSAPLGDAAPPWTAGTAIPTGDFPKIQNLVSSDFQAPLDGCMSASMNSLTAQGWDTGQGLSAVAMPRPALDPDEDRMIQ